MRHHSYLKRSLYPFAISGNSTPWVLPALCRTYGFPTGMLGGGVIAIIELGGGDSPGDISKFFSRTRLPHPVITNVSVLGATNNGDVTDPASGEVALDEQIAGGVYGFCTGKPAQIRIYWGPNTLDAISSCIAKAAVDGCDVCSISWGSDEANWGQPAAHQLECTAQAATAAGMIIFAASGDNDSSDGGQAPANVDLPASAPHVIGCGGTMRPHNSSLANPETVWNNNPGNANGEGTGGGYSTISPMSAWMAGAPGTMRMVPDLAANADPNTGYHIILGGVDHVFGGTSAVAPLMAGLFASFGRKLGFVSPKLWQNHLAFNDITVGDNGQFRAGPGPDPCSGLGSPRGQQIASLFVK